MACRVIEIRGKVRASAELDGRNPGIAAAIWQALPVKAIASLWWEKPDRALQRAIGG
ncbi:Uncharacterised protein [uncultured archaeon]|nr:Uncharacterised protein [uncultured archaeon]